MLLGLGLATWTEFYKFDGVNLVLPDMAGTLGLSQDEASWILTRPFWTRQSKPPR
jgi:MFS transporter, DHA2 family, multidrug resistance protein